MRRSWIYVAGLSVVAMSTASLAFEEQKLRQAQPVAPSASTTSAGGQPGAALTDPGIAPPRIDSGTKIRVPGLGVIGEIPKMDFGLELLYGASQPKSAEIERGEGNGVMGRVTVPLKPSR